MGRKLTILTLASRLSGGEYLEYHLRIPERDRYGTFFRYFSHFSSFFHFEGIVDGSFH